MNKPLLSIITVVKNGEQCIQTTVTSVLEQTYPLIEFIIIDGNSSDNTKRQLQQFKNKIDMIVSEPDEGIYEAMNRGIHLANGDYLNFLNCGDAYVDAQTIERVFGGSKNDSTSDLIYGNIVLTNEFKNEIKPVKALPLSVDNLIREGTRTVCHQAVFLKKKIAPIFNHKYRIISDLNWYFDLLLQNKGVKIEYLDEVIVRYRVDGISSKQFIPAMLERLKIVYRQFGFLVLIKNIHYFLKQILYRMLMLSGLKRFPAF